MSATDCTSSNSWTSSELMTLKLAKAAVERFDLDGYAKHMTPALLSKLELLGDPTKTTDEKSGTEKHAAPVRPTHAQQTPRPGRHPKQR